ncbi:MAG: hypothetical protein AB7I27_09385 [Bacteriovoracaceae bacterium]
MLIVQKFHSIHEIDPEFIANLEVLLQEDMPNFNSLIEQHDKAPAGDVFTYFLFFGPTQNAPVGFAQLCLRPIPWQGLLPWWKRLIFWKRDHLHWKQARWQMVDGTMGLCVFDPKFARTGKEKMQELIKEYQVREDIMAQHFYYIKGLQEFQIDWKEHHKWTKETYVLEPLTKASKTYQQYLEHLKPEIQKQIKQSWKTLHMNQEIKLGEYRDPSQTPKNLPIKEDVMDYWKKVGAQVLTFEKGSEILGCLVVYQGKNGNVFFEPIPFEPTENAIVPDEIYTQYALLKFFEMRDSRKCHLLKFGSKLIFDEKEDLVFFQEQGFQLKTVNQSFYSRLSNLSRPI